LEKWGSLVLLRGLEGDLLNLPAESPLTHFKSYVAGAKVKLPSGTTALIASVHAVARMVADEWTHGLDIDRIRRPMLDQPFHNDLAFHGLAQLIDGPFIIGGDWNTSRLFDDDAKHAGAGSAFFDRAERQGWVECLWQMHGEEQRTWFRQGDRSFQLDHLFCDSELAELLTACNVLTDAVTETRLSDHAPVLAEFEV
jgi:endonuclease/exonuclease/phosphatase (EEP) superfamily protein YafD